jgi:hypothetical protein
LEESVPLLRDMAVSSYLSINSNEIAYHRLPGTPRGRSTSHLETIHEIPPHSTASVAQQTENFDGASSSEGYQQSEAAPPEDSRQN